MKNVRRIAADYLKKYAVIPKELSAGRVREIIGSQGYDIVEFSSVYNSEDVEQLISLLNLEDFIVSNRGFTYVDNSNRIVFVNSDLSETESLYVLLHEQGHILCEHFDSKNIIGNDVIQEFEANEFLHFFIQLVWRRFHQQV